MPIMKRATASATPEFTIALLIAKAQAIVIRISQDIYLVYLYRKYLCPYHNDSSNGNEEKHIQLDFRKSFLDNRKFTNRCTHYHQYQQNQGKPALSLSGHRFRILAIGKQHEHRRFPQVFTKESSAITTSVSPSRRYSFSRFPTML